MFEPAPPVPTLLEAIHDPSKPIGMRMRSAYYLRHAYKQRVDTQDADKIDDDLRNINNTVIVDALVGELRNIEHGSLMRHEFAYVLGQLQDTNACMELEACVKNQADCVMVRHEAAEALGAIGDASSIAVMQQICDDPNAPLELRDTCQLSVELIEWKQRQQERHDRGDNDDPDDAAPPICACLQTPYSAVDPGLPPSSHYASLSVAQLGEILLQPEATLKDRYQAMFTLRNRGGAEAVQWLCRALLEDTSSALLRHEVAYVLGQVQHPESVDALEESLRRTEEHKMVRHESAEALGAIDGRWEDVERILREFLNDTDDVVRESCLVALDAADYWGHSDVSGHDIREVDDVDANSSFAQVKAGQRVLINGHFNRVDE